MITQRTRIAIWRRYFCEYCEKIIDLNIPVDKEQDRFICPLCKITYLRRADGE